MNKIFTFIGSLVVVRTIVVLSLAIPTAIALNDNEKVKADTSEIKRDREALRIEWCQIIASALFEKGHYTLGSAYHEASLYGERRLARLNAKRKAS